MLKLCAFFILVLQVNCLYVVLEENEQRCFLEEMPKDTLVLIKYKAEEILAEQRVQTPGGHPALGIKITINDPEGKQFISRDHMIMDGRFAFTSQIGGEHKVCFKTNSTSGWFGAKRRVKFSNTISIGAEATDYEELAKSEHLSALEVQVRKLNDRIRTVRAEQSYQRGREMTFRNTSESTNSRAMWWSIIQIGVLVSTGLWQINYLKNFFKAKKVV